MGALFIHLVIARLQQPSAYLRQDVHDFTAGELAASHPSASSKAFKNTPPIISTTPLFGGDEEYRRLPRALQTSA
ncbi:hypothetical protein PAHAL_9G340100 [Panicum hallii]|uniref:Uncharacterized protein n=1 Tax=Panicum hallii TaxID=206008 RepID=A0A2T8I3C4_9POAL|nr:hypothetical protein PAHAL_9G340100 [Panicum hallii]